MDEGFAFPREERIRLTPAGYRKLCALVDERDDYHCKLCHATTGLHHHHIRFRSAWGSDTIDNLILLCYKCHDIYAHGEKEKGYQKVFEGYTDSEHCKRFKEEHKEELERIYQMRRKKK